MNLGPHLAASTVAGAAVWAATGEWNALPAAIAAGVLPDADHVPDYYLRYVRRERRFLFLVFHAWEYLVVGMLVYLFAVREPWMLAVLLGYATQIGGDQLFNKVRWHTYFITARALHGFRLRESLGREDGNSHMAVIKSLPFGRTLLLRWFEARR